MRPLRTIGHSTLPIQDFLETLAAHGVTRLVDVRTVPRSRHNPQFEGAALARELERRGIGYVHMPGLGGLRRPRPESPNTGWRNDSFRGYADHMQTAGFRSSLDALLAMLEREAPAVMCAEAVPWRCHRNLIADAAVARGVPVEHIFDAGTRRPHVLTPWATVVDGEVSYPARPNALSPTIEYYDEHARTFFEGTVGIDMAALHARFLARLPPGAAILDAGCGSGRDARAFAEQGYAVTAFDASPELARLAGAHCGFAVAVRTFADVREVATYDGVWCCASLLHVPHGEMGAALDALWRGLRPGGVLYASFKLGSGEREAGGRTFTDADEATVRRWLAALPGVEGIETWTTADLRPGRDESWVNALSEKQLSEPF